jgi:hypothetical protein
MFISALEKIQAFQPQIIYLPQTFPWQVDFVVTESRPEHNHTGKMGTAPHGATTLNSTGGYRFT